MNSIFKNSVRFIIFVLIQVLIFNQLEFGIGIQLMVYPLFIVLLPVELGIFPLLLIAFVMGISIDAMSNTYGLHASSLVAMAYFRPIFFKLFAPRDGYDPLTETNIYQMGPRWFYQTFGILLLIHHFWFFMLEMFKLNELFFVLQKTLISMSISLIVCIFLQYLFLKKPKEK